MWNMNAVVARSFNDRRFWIDLKLLSVYGDFRHA
jgi:hypothetical protein